MQTENKYLQVQGVVNQKILHQLLGTKRYTKQNTKWLFVDFSPFEYKINTKFDVILAGNEKKLLPKFFNIKLLDVIDQTGKHLNEIPLGWKTICRFEFIGSIPSVVQKLPTISAWEYNTGLKFARHEDVVVDPFNLSKNIYTEVISDFISFSVSTPSINKKHALDFLDIVSKIIHENSDDMEHKINNPDLVEEFKKKEFHPN